MKKMLGITLFFPLCILFILGYVQVLSKELNFPLESSMGNASILNGVTLETTLYTNTSTSPLVRIKDGESKVSYVDSKPYDMYQYPPISQRELLLQENPVLDESKKEKITEGYFSYDSSGELCDIYAYPQSEAQLVIDIETRGSDKWIKTSAFQTNLKVYPQDYYTLNALYVTCDKRRDADPYLSVNQHLEQVQVEQAANHDYYMMPVVRPNMDGEVSVYRIHETIDQESTKSNQMETVEWEEKSRYDIPVSKGMYGYLKVVNDQIYVWIWKEDVLTLQVLDEELNLILESKEALPLLNMPIVNPEVYQNDNYLIFNLQDSLIVYDLEGGKFIQQYNLKSMMEEDYVINDVYYKNDKLYLSVNEDTPSQYNYNPSLLVCDENVKIYHAELKLSNRTSLDNDEVYPNYAQADKLKFVR